MKLYGFKIIKKIYKDKAYLLREQYKKDKQTYELNKKGITISH